MQNAVMRLARRQNNEQRRRERQEIHETPAGESGTLILDDGANWRVTLVFSGGVLTSVTTAASSGATASWS
jgi:hypothetical protein